MTNRRDGVKGSDASCVAMNFSGFATAARRAAQYVGVLFVVATLAVLAGCGGGSSSGGSGSGGSGSGGTTTAPSITTQPTSQTVTAGQTATFSVTASGTSPSYQWQSRTGSSGAATMISGANSASYTTPATTTAQSGTQFSVVVSNSAGSVTSNWVPLTVNAAATVPTISTQPASQTVITGQTATFTVVAAGGGLTYQWEKTTGSTTTPITGATGASYTTAATTSGDNGSEYSVVVTNSAGTATSSLATLTVNAGGGGTPTAMDVTTYHNDLARTGLNDTENTLTQSNVNFHNFGLLGSLSVDGLVDGQPLFLSNLSIGGVSHNVVFVVTENDSVYAFDADTQALLWHDGPSALLPSGENASDEPDGCTQIGSEVGITSTPVIDRTAGANGTMFLVTMSKDGSGNYHQRIHGIDVTTGAELLGGPTTIAASYPGTGAGSSNGTITFNPEQYKNRAGLMLLNGVVYTAWASHCDSPPYSAWVLGYKESTLTQSVVFNLTPNGGNTAGGSFGSGSIWMSGGGLASDSEGYIYAALANGAFETTLTSSGFPSKNDYGNALVKLKPGTSTLTVSDYFNMDNTIAESAADTDLGSGGVVVIPDQKNASGSTVHLIMAAGKDGNMYIANRDNMGKFKAGTTNSNVYQFLSGVLPNGVWGTPAYFNNTIYSCPKDNSLRAFPISQAKVGAASSHTSATFIYPGVLPAVSADGTANGIVWAIENTSPPVLHAFPAAYLGNEIYNSNQAPNNADHPAGSGNKFVTPMIAMGKVFVATSNSVAVYGLLSVSR